MEKWAVGVGLDRGGARVITVGGVDWTHLEKLLDCDCDHVDGVGGFFVRHEEESRSAWFHKPFGEVVVCVVARSHEMADNISASFDEGGANSRVSQGATVISIERNERQAA